MPGAQRPDPSADPTARCSAAGRHAAAPQARRCLAETMDRRATAATVISCIRTLDRVGGSVQRRGAEGQRRRARYALRCAASATAGAVAVRATAAHDARELHPPAHSASPSANAPRRPGHRPHARRDAEDPEPTCLMYSLSASLRAEALLDRDERLRGSRWKQMKNRPASSCAEPLVDAVGEGVAAAQDRALAVVVRAGEADVRVERDRRRAVASARRGRPGRTRRRRRAARRSTLWRPIVCSWSASERAVPDLDQHPDAARDQVGAAAPSRRARRPPPTQTCWSQRVGVLGLDVVRCRP